MMKTLIGEYHCEVAGKGNKTKTNKTIKESIVSYNRYGFLPGRGKLDDCQNEIITVYVHPNPLNKIVKIEIMNYLCAGFSCLCLSLKVFQLNKTIYSLLQILL